MCFALQLWVVYIVYTYRVNWIEGILPSPLFLRSVSLMASSGDSTKTTFECWSCLVWRNTFEGYVQAVLLLPLGSTFRQYIQLHWINFGNEAFGPRLFNHLFPSCFDFLEVFLMEHHRNTFHVLVQEFLGAFSLVPVPLSNPMRRYQGLLVVGETSSFVKTSSQVTWMLFYYRKRVCSLKLTVTQDK